MLAALVAALQVAAAGAQARAGEASGPSGAGVGRRSEARGAVAERASRPEAGEQSLLDAASEVPGLVVDLRYATPDNFLGRAVYPPGARCKLLPAVARRLATAARRLAQDGLRLKAWDCYRPHRVQWEMWKIFPKDGYVADPRKGSNHNRGGAVDVTVVHQDGSPAEVPTPFDEFSARAHDGATDGVSPAARANAGKLRAAMHAAGFKVNPMEWWHFDAPEAKGARVLDLPVDR